VALINCGECGREISDRASICPHCGCPVRPVGPTKKPGLGKGGRIALIVLAAGLIVGAAAFGIATRSRGFPHALSMVVLLTEHYDRDDGQGGPCWGIGPYSKLQPGAVLSVVNQDGKDIRWIFVQYGTFNNEAISGEGSTGCTFTLEGVVPDADSYSFWLKGTQLLAEYSRSQLEDMGWLVSLAGD
jgi:hypothetical protein